MTQSESGERLHLALTAPLRQLIMEDGKAAQSPDVIDNWDIPEEAKMALTEIGLPVMDSADVNAFHADLQETVEPAVHYRDVRLFRLGLLAGHVIGIPAGRDIVFGIPDNPLWHVAFVNSSVEKFVETCWRYSYAEPAFRVIEPPAIFETLALVWEAFLRIDQAIYLDRSISMWQAIVEEWI